MSGAGFAGPPTSDEERVVLHVDMDCFYAACERRREPTLRGKPVVVGMGYEAGEPHGAVATASYEAREHGVESAQPISQALEALPRAETAPDDHDGPVGHYRPVDMAYYREVSDEIRAILHGVADAVREVSIDEAYLDVTDRVGWHSVEVFASSLKERIDEEIGVPASVGVGPNMSVAKVASDYDKPDGLVVVEPAEVREFLAPLPVEELHGVGPVTARELRGMGVGTAGDLASADRDALVSRFGARGGTIHDHARGRDPRPVEPVGKPKSLSSESAFTEPTDAFDAVCERLLRLADEVVERTESRDALYKTIGIKVVRPPFDVNTRERSLSGPVADADLVESVVLDLAEEFEGETVRKLGVRVSNLTFAEGTQAPLDEWEGEREGGVGAEDGLDEGEARSEGPDRDDGRSEHDRPADRARGQTTFVDFT
ncbi:DNA polymerase IV [Halomarina halobia]|uniref:DNA polymerase IV n=1 Tax=Halomarina halobia TaxID=3033386 RepID=A0ABD6A5E7_9EURY|nr:DNA polymerase IV [Halomarina sp. PSR21]